MTKPDAITLADRLNATAGGDVQYEVRETQNPKGGVSPFYVARTVLRGAAAEDTDPQSANPQLQLA